MADVFLSYAREDLERVKALVAALEAAGLAVWYDQTLRAGADFGAETAAELDKAAHVVVVWSQSSAVSKWVRDEASAGCDAGKLVPVSIDGALPPLGFRQLQTIDFGGWSGDGSAPPLAALIAALKSSNAAAPPAVATHPAPAPFGRRRAAIAVAAGLALMAAGAALFAIRASLSEEGKPESVSAAAPALPAANAKSVAVLPFVALSAGEEDGYFADGLSEEIINALTTVPDLLVTARTSAFHFKGKDTPVPEIAKALGVAHVVEGSVRRSGDKARITAQLIRAEDGFHLWSQSYDRPLGDDFTVQGEIAESVATALGVLLDAQSRGAMTDAGVRNVEAFLAYQRGRELFTRAHNDGPLVPLLAKANIEFAAALASAPDFAQAHFQHADYYAHFLIDEAPGKGPDYLSETGLGVAEAERRLIDDLDAALRHEKDHGQRLVIEAVRTTVSSDWRGLKEKIARAYASWDNCRFGLWLDQTGVLFGLGEAVHKKDIERTRCDPLGDTWYRAAESAIWLGRIEEGIALADRAEAAQGRNSYLIHARALAALALGKAKEAESLLAEGRFDSADVPEFQKLLVYQVPAAAGRAEEWERLKAGLESDPERMLVAAAVFGDREAANEAAAAIDAMTLGPTILIRIADRCGCGKPFDLEATPKFARLLRDADLPWTPLAPINYPLKDW